MPPRPPSGSELAAQAVRLINAGQHKAAERMLKGILRADPDQFDALLALGVLCGMRGEGASAVRHLTRAVRRRPQSPDALYNLGQALIGLGRHGDAIEPLSRAAGAEGLPHIHEKLGDCLRQVGRLDEAAAHYARALAAPQLAGSSRAMLLSSLVETKRRICDWSGLAPLEAELADAVQRGHAIEPLLALYVLDDPALQSRNACAYAREFLRPMIPQALLDQRFDHARRRAGAEPSRLRIGYLCSDFRNHATSYLIAGLIERHDRTRLEVIGLSFGPDDGSPVRKRLEKGFDRLVDLRTATSLEIAKRINTLGIDILVDLNGYIANGRPEILAARPAPVQCHYLAFPGTLGAPWIDYHIVDGVVAAAGDDAHFTEALVRMPDSYQANDRGRVAAAPPSRAAAGLPERGVVLCCFNNAIKLSPAMLDVWARIVSAVPDSVLWLFADNAWCEANLRREIASRGVDPARLVHAPYVGPAAHLARLPLADLLLDTLPYGAHTTASDALWMGVPVLTARGHTFAGRVGASLLTAAGLPELIMPSLAAYEREAIALARDPARLSALKSRLAAVRDTCALFDTDRFARHLEAAYQEMWSRWRRGEPARAFAVPDAQP